jgi:hypothetical protein
MAASDELHLRSQVVANSAIVCLQLLYQVIGRPVRNDLRVTVSIIRVSRY